MKNNRLEGKVALVTGSGAGIGRAIAEKFAESGAKVAVADIHEKDGLAVVDAIKSAGGEARFWHLDVSKEAEVTKVLQEAKAAFGPITVLVNNAGIAGANKATDQLTEAEWDLVQSVNVKGVFFCTKHVIPQMREAKVGSIINMSSVYGIVSAPDLPPYHASKGAVRLMTKTDALYYAKDKIRVNSIHPGFIITPMVQGFLGGADNGESLMKAVADLHPLGHMGEPQDIAYGALYLASEEAKFVTGSELVIDGGFIAR